MASKEFKVVSISTNTNAFGLRGVVVVARDGDAWTLAGNALMCERHPQGSVFTADPARGFDGWEIPHPYRPLPPPELLREIWPDSGAGEPAIVLACEDRLGRTPAYLLLELTKVCWLLLLDFHRAWVQCTNASRGQSLMTVDYEWTPPLQWATSGFVACLDQREHATPTAYGLPSMVLKELGFVCYRQLPVELSELDADDAVITPPPRLVLSRREQEHTLSWGANGVWTVPVSWGTLCDCRERSLRPPTGFDALCRP